jgi:F-type H+-transporting ATPase subunit epsilon
MATTIQLDVVSAEKELFSGTVSAVFAPAIMGDVGIYPRHTPLVTSLRPGELKIEIEDEEDQYLYVSGGILEVQPHVVTILSDTAIRAEDLDEAKVLEAKQRAEEALKDQKGEFDTAKAQVDLIRAAEQLRMIERMRKIRK